MTTRGTGIEPMLLRSIFGDMLPIGVRTLDGVHIGPAQPPVIVLRSRDALRHLAWSPGELGLARAYVAGALDFDGDLRDGLRLVWRLMRPDGTIGLGAARRLQLARLASRSGLLAPAKPASEVSLRGRRHSRDRDREAVSHNYDVSNDFYELLLDPGMVYSCAYWSADGSEQTLADAQREKLDLICRKLRLWPGARLLDVGCGWGSLILHAAEHYGVHATGVTLSTQQYEYARARVDAAKPGGAGSAEVRLQDYRDIDAELYDAITAVEMSEHIGARNYGRFITNLHDRLVDGGRLLIQQMSRAPRTTPGGGVMVERYIAPDMEMWSLGRTIGLLEEGGFEVSGVEGMREHYARTLHAWTDTLERRMAAVAGLLGEEAARVWLFYMASDAIAFEQGRSGVDQILAVRRCEPAAVA